MDYLAKNLKTLRKQYYSTQEEMAQALGLKKSTYASYENDDGNTPPAKTLYTIAKLFAVPMDTLFDLDYRTLDRNKAVKISEREIYFPVSVDLAGSELIDVVPSDHQAQAGYLSEYSDPSYIRSLPKISWDMGTHEVGTKRIFQISGDSMIPIPSGSFILTAKTDYEDLVSNDAYILITQNDILFKRVRKEAKHLQLLSDNSIYPQQLIEADEVLQYWKALKVILDMPKKPLITIDQIHATVQDTNQKVSEMTRRRSTT
ncbi:MAG: helix-turn-helix domain-containing protein [Saprospiraceae bacterium]|nr:helix-turn-helix domain-containing protein [Saprospiraceae bacterium]